MTAGPSSTDACSHCGAVHAPEVERCPRTDQPMDEPGLIGTDVDRYRVRRWLGGGGFGAVYEAEHAMVGRRVALKVLHTDHGRSRTAVKRFFEEARAAAAIGHPHIIQVFDGGVRDRLCFLAMELVDGCSLAELLKARSTLPIARAAGVLFQVIDALEAAHAAGIVHRDVKPANIMLEGTRPDAASGRDFVRLVDFGICKVTRDGEEKLTRTGTGMGTPGFGAPEQFLSADRVDARADVYAASAVLFQMLTGELPHPETSSYEEYVVRVCTQAPRRLEAIRDDLPVALSEVLAQGLAIDPAQRIPSARALADALKVVLDGWEEDAPASPPATVDIGVAPTMHAAETARLTPPPPTARDPETPAERPPRSTGKLVAAALGGVLVLGAAVAVGVGLGGGDDASSGEGETETRPAATPADPAPSERATEAAATEAAATEAAGAEAGAGDAAPPAEVAATGDPEPADPSGAETPEEPAATARRGSRRRPTRGERAATPAGRRQPRRTGQPMSDPPVLVPFDLPGADEGR